MAILLTGLNREALCQSDALKGRFEVIKDARIELPTANRYYDKAEITPTQANTKPQNYEIKDVELSLPKLPAKIKVASVKNDELPRLYGGYVKAGFGNYITPYAEFFLSNKRNKNYSYGLHGRHLSSSRGPVRYSGTSLNELSLFGKYFSTQSTISADLSYQRQRVNYYGFDQNIFPFILEDTIKQVYQTFAANAKLENTNLNSLVSYNIQPGFIYFKNNFKRSEQELYAIGYLRFKAREQMNIQTDLHLSNSKLKDTSTLSRNYFAIKPYGIYEKNRIKFHGGFNVNYTNDTSSQYKNDIHLYPYLHAQYEISKNKTYFFTGLDGGMKKNMYRFMVAENPYLQSNNAIVNPNCKYTLYAGIKGNLSNKVNYLVQMNNSRYSNFYFFANAEKDSSRFDALYDSRHTDELKAKLEIVYSVIRQIRMGGEVNYFAYKVSSIEQPWQRPALIGKIFALYNLREKIYFNLDIYYISSAKGKNLQSGKESVIPQIIDPNLKIEYKFSDTFSAFVQANNLRAKKYQRYLYYPVRGINVLGGISFSF
ncbi:MAG: hypothetical protein NZ529_06770 [Cytophagaceae bacterium]|nr:hypothetical protein [Cytophagaceae bacterium]MDW8456483.1 hypothetical protein [Cytophagaceae bacterium]